MACACRWVSRKCGSPRARQALLRRPSPSGAAPTTNRAARRAWSASKARSRSPYSGAPARDAPASVCRACAVPVAAVRASGCCAHDFRAADSLLHLRAVVHLLRRTAKDEQQRCRATQDESLQHRKSKWRFPKTPRGFLASQPLMRLRALSYGSHPLRCRAGQRPRHDLGRPSARRTHATALR